MHFFLPCAYLSFFLSSVTAFSVSFSAPSQCDPFTVSWSGGQAPFEILLTPVFSPMINLSVPSSAFVNGKGSYTIPQLQIANSTQFLLTMSDGTGFGSGGTTTLLTVGMPIENNNCNTKLSQDFIFWATSQLKQCAYFTFSNYSGAIQPVTIMALIPGGIPSAWVAPLGDNYTWMADVVAGTDMLFAMTDSQGRQGGASDIEAVQSSTDSSCLVAGALSSTVTSPSEPTSSQSNFSSGSNTPNAGVIAGATVGSVVGFALLVLLGIWCKRRSSRSYEKSSSNGRSSHDYKVAEVGGIPQPFPFEKTPGHPGNPTQPVGNAAANTSPAPFSHLTVTPENHPGSDGDNGLFSSARRRLAAIAGRAISPSYAFPYQTGPTGLPQSTHPVTETPLAANDPLATFNPIQPVRQFRDPELSAGYRDAGGAGIQTSPTAGQTTYPSQYQMINPQYTSTGSSEFSASDPPSPLHHPQPLNLTSTIERFERPADVGENTSPGARAAEPADPRASPTQYIVHKDVDDVQPAAGASRVVELPPQYADRPLASPPMSLESSM